MPMFIKSKRIYRVHKIIKLYYFYKSEKSAIKRDSLSNFAGAALAGKIKARFGRGAWKWKGFLNAQKSFFIH
jgi:hypothetical protein